MACVYSKQLSKPKIAQKLEMVRFEDEEMNSPSDERYVIAFHEDNDSLMLDKIADIKRSGESGIWIRPDEFYEKPEEGLKVLDKLWMDYPQCKRFANFKQPNTSEFQEMDWVLIDRALKFYRDNYKQLPKDNKDDIDTIISVIGDMYK